MSPPESVPQAKFTKNEGTISTEVIKLLKRKTGNNSINSTKTMRAPTPINICFKKMYHK